VSLTDDLLELARAEAGQLEIELGQLRLTDLTHEVVEDYRAQADSAGLIMNADLPAYFPVIESDAGRVRQILGNLMSNAIKYTPKGSVTVRIDTGEGDHAPSPGHWAAVRVTDTGPGLSSEQIRALFEEFKRFAPGVEGGTGIGLAISRTLARLLGGDITVVSTVGQGSTFTLWLPLK
jgi:signal transduction histidine kinase